MRWAAVTVVLALGSIGLVQAMHLTIEVGRKAAWVASASQCWNQNVEYRGKLPHWEH